MLTFLRKIRKSLIVTTSVRKYLLYAIGEIGLVVIGILIALQINNWNEWRKDRITEEKVLIDLVDNLERNIVTINSSIVSNESKINSANLILNILDKKLAYSDTLDQHFFNGIILGQVEGFPAKDGYEAFKNNGFEKVLNETLKKRTIFLFEETYKRLETWGSYANSFAPNGSEIWNKYFKRGNSSLRPLDYKDFLNNTEIYNTYESSKGFNNVYLNRLRNSLKETDAVLQLIKTELREE